MSDHPRVMFSPDQLSKLVADTLPTDARPGEKVVVGTVDANGAQVVASLKFRPRNKDGSLRSLTWEVQTAARHEWSGDDSAAAKVLLRWS